MYLVDEKMIVALALLGLVPSLIVASYTLLNPPCRATYEQMTKEGAHGFLSVVSIGAPYLIILGVALCTLGLLAGCRSLPNTVNFELASVPSLVNELQQRGMNSFTIWDKKADFTVACTYLSSTRTDINVAFTQKQLEPGVRKHLLSLPAVKLLPRFEDTKMIVLEAHADLGMDLESLMPLFVTVIGLAPSDYVYIMYDRVDAIPYH